MPSQSEKSSNRVYYIYVVINIETGDSYVGKSVDPEYRWGVHKSKARNERSRTTHFYKALHCYGDDKFRLTVIDHSFDEKHAYLLEKQHANRLKEQGVRLYNEKDCGLGGHSNPSPELRKKLSESRKGERHPLWGKPGTRLGCTNTPEMIEKFKSSVRNKRYRENSSTYGRSPSQKTRKIWSDQRRGRPHHNKPRVSDQERQQIIELFDGGRGMTAQEIAIKMKRSVSTVHKIVRNYVEMSERNN